VVRSRRQGNDAGEPEVPGELEAPGELERFGEAVERHKDRLFTFALYFLGDRSLAEDVTQEVLLKLWRNWRKLDGVDLAAWLTTVTRNASYDALRVRQRSRARLLPVDETAHALPDTSPDPARRAVSSQLGKRMREALAELAEPYRSIVVWREIQQMPHQEIADTLGMPLSTVKVYAHRARKKLREVLRDDLDPEIEDAAC
jgi:RNA polymerase sigma-70 factor (ECF subfamily)